MAADPDEAIQQIGTIIFGVAIVAVVLSTLVGTFAIAQGSIPLDNGVATFDSADTKKLKKATIRDTTGRAVAVDGSGGVEISGGIGVRGKSWHLSTYVSVENTSRSQVVWTVRDNYVLAYDADRAVWALWYYNDSSTNSYRVEVSASPTAGTLTNVQASRDGRTLTVYNSSGASASLTIDPTTANSATLPTSQTLEGRLEETRTWSGPLNATQRQRLRNAPIKPVGVGNRTGRLMFDTSGDGVAVDFRAASGSLVGSASRAPGFAGSILTAGVDYRVDATGTGARLVALKGGALENMPRVAVDHSGLLGLGILGQLLGVLNSALVVLVLVAVAIGGSWAYRQFGGGGF